MEKKQKGFDNSFFDSIRNGDVEKFDWSLTRGAKVRGTRGAVEKHSPLMVAAINGRDEFIAPLIEAKADPYAIDSVRITSRPINPNFQLTLFFRIGEQRCTGRGHQALRRLFVALASITASPTSM